MKLIVIILLLAIAASLGSGLFYLAKDDQGSPRVLRALKIRVALSATLIAFLLVAYFAGWIEPMTAP
ncbi:MAG: twin transmembrane helix small protein [Gammaproteobacteria bacterium]|nr:twin transmembrane helix small protein [Gammaproteobacteria bacterium]MDH4256679.1 twin transmembrane helix small protein [Gammaproteobacteria bacterium]MDH5311689.1 twin transmembrane helix small protein [Gammaproteobacteria bacterium]